MLEDMYSISSTTYELHGFHVVTAWHLIKD